MKLAIAVVYVVTQETEALLDLHLSQIEKNTRTPYRIYAAANRSEARYRARLQSSPSVQLCELPGTGLRGAHEHSFYLEQLVALAITDGATHVCTLHLDSFPIRVGWETDLAAKLSGGCVLVAIMSDELSERQPGTALMMFPREFYLAHRPAFLLPSDAQDSEQYREYSALWKHKTDSGVGYGFKIFAEGLTWMPLTRADKCAGGYSFGIFGDVVFHLGGAVYSRHSGNAWKEGHSAARTLPVRWLEAADRLCGRALRRCIPRRLWVQLLGWFPAAVKERFGASRLDSRQAELLADPDGFLERLRNTRVSC